MEKNEKKAFSSGIDGISKIRQDYERYVSVREFHNAYMLILRSLRKEKNHTQELMKMGMNLINADVEKIWAYSFWKQHYLPVDISIKVDHNWLIDRVLEAGYDKVRTGVMGDLVIGPYPSYSWHNYRIKRDGICYICHNRAPLAKDHIRMLEAIAVRLLKEYAAL
jgi:hypothetical protein